MGEVSATESNLMQPSAPKPVELPKLLIGEGYDEVNFFDAVLKHLGITDIAVEQYAGKANLDRYLAALKARSGFSQLRALGITRDADESASNVFASVSGNLRKRGLSIPTALNQVANGSPAIAVFVLPDCVRAGMLEDLCLDSVVEDLAIPCVGQFFDCVKQAGRIPQNMAKARVHAWLASKEVPDKRLGQAAGSGYWPFDHPAFEAIKDFLRSL